MFIYYIKCHATMCVYVGATSNPRRRFNEHRSKLRKGKHPNRLLQKDWDNHRDQFEFTVLEEITAETRYNIAEAEKRHCETMRGKGFIYNIRPDPQSNKFFRHSEETKKKISNTLRGRDTLSPEARKRQAETIRGRPKPPHVTAAAQAGIKRWRSDPRNVEQVAKKQATLADSAVRKIKAATEPYSTLSRQYGVSAAIICRIRQGKAYKWVR